MTLTGGPQIRLEARIRERSNCVIDGQCQLWSSDRMFHNYCSPQQRDRDAVLPESLSKMSHEWMNVKRKRNECMTDWMNEWMNQLCSPASWGVHSNEYSQKRGMNDAWVAALSAFSVRGFPSKSKNEIREIQICTTIKEKLVLQLYATRKYPEYYWNNC